MRKQCKQWDTLFSWAPKITADGDCSHEIKICLFFGREAMTNLDSILKSRDITLPTMVYLVKAMVFPVIIYGCESWTIKKAAAAAAATSLQLCPTLCDPIDGWAPKNWCFWTVVLEKTRESPLDNKEMKLVDPKGNKPEYSLERLKLKHQYLATKCKEPAHWKRPWCWERFKAGGEGDERGQNGWISSLIQWTWVWANSGR